MQYFSLGAFISLTEKAFLKNKISAGKDEHPTHLILQFTSSMGGAFVGSPGNKLWIDNVNLVY
jgi:hypothetical protein